MACHRRFFIKVITSCFFIILFPFQKSLLAAEGETIFKTYCASCHKPDVEYTGPPLKGARERAPSKDWVYKWVANTTSMVQTDPYARKLFEQYGSVMTPFPDLKKEDIDAVLDWAD